MTATDRPATDRPRTDWTNNDAWRGTRADLHKATGLNPDCYAGEEFFALEQVRVFERAWVIVGTSPEVAEPGRLLVRRVGRRSILISRDNEGVLRGFYNTCRHRGTELAEADCDVAGTIRCPYHRWSYGLDGVLKATPRFDDVPRQDFNRSDFSLLGVRVDTWGPLLFACLDAETPPLAEWLGDLPERMAGYGFESWRIQEEATVEIAANWKLISENFQEYYHLTWVHPELAKISRVKDHYRYQGPGMYCGQTTTPVTGTAGDAWLVLPVAEGLDESDATSGRHLAVYPNVIFSVLPNHVFVMRLEPIAPGLTRETCTFLLPASTPPVTADDMAATRDFWIDINNEDIDICQRGQRGLTYGHIEPGPLAPRFEQPLHRFHNMLADCLTADSLQTGLTIPAGDDGSLASRLGTKANPCPPQIEK